MRLSHRDFRPAKRSKYVASPPRKRPTLRILLLIAFGILVYLKFDSFVKSKAVQSLRTPEKLWLSLRKKLHLEPAIAPIAVTSDATASETDLDCASPSVEACLSAWKAAPETKGRSRALVAKAMAAADLGALEGFSLRLRPRAQEDADDSAAADAESLELRAGGRALSLERGKDGGYCFRGGPCLEKPRPLPPLRKYELGEAGGGEASLKAPEGAPALAVLPGRILQVTVDSAGAAVEVRHGFDLACRYRGLAAAREGLRAGAWVGAGDTLGFLGAREPRLLLRVEKGGRAVDAFAFLGLPPR